MKRRQKNALHLTEFPSGAVVETELGRWYINGKFRHRIKNKRVFKTWNFSLVIEAPESSLAKYLKGKPLGFRDGTLVGDISDGKVYLIAGKQRRPLTSPESFEALGLKRSDAIWAAHDEITLHPEGEVL